MSNVYERLFETVKIGNMVLKNRVVFAPVHTRFFEGTDETYNHWHNEYFRERAKGGVGLIITGLTKAEKQIDPYYLDNITPTIDSDQRIKEFAEIAETVHHYGAKITAQLTPGVGRLADSPQPDRWPAAPSAQPLIFRPDLMAREFTKSEITGMVQAFGEASGRLRRAGFDALFINGHNYLLDQFISECWNKRSDEYGGSLKNRLRFFIECFECARAFVGEDFPVIVSLAMEHRFEGGRTLDESIVIAKEIEKLGVDAFFVRDGSYNSILAGEVTHNAFCEEGMALRNAAKFKREVKAPVIVGEQIGDPDQCEKAIVEARVDFIAIGRGLLSDPEWPNKVRQGKVEEIRPCIKCMECFTRYFEGKYVGCTVNPRLGHEREFPIMPAYPAKKVLVIGGGPAGMEAARIAASRGHNVTLMDKNENLGGLLIPAAVPDYKFRLGRYAAWLERQLENTGVDVQRGIKVTSDTVKEMKPDAVILAMGAKPGMPDVPGMEKANIVHCLDVFSGKAEVGEKTVIIGGNLVGCETAYCLAKQGKKIEIVEMLPEILSDVSFMNKVSMMGALFQYGVASHVNFRLSQVKDEGVVITDTAGEEKFLEADTIVIATGFVSDDTLYKSLEGLTEEIYRIGDSLQPRKIYDAVHEGYLAGKEI